MEKAKGTNCNFNEQEMSKFCTNFHRTIEFIGKRWMGMIIYQLLSGPKRYYELMESIPSISDRLLTERLRDLENEGLIIKKALVPSQRKVEYELTPAGKQLETVITSIFDWVKNRESME
ncbi:winged helix-turn-helix transcriptional regulator [Neobacillus mesonae]|uniref:Transcriptional regulator n=1 Tax=Neobacillus mesonae TaxID=1193713 RepID=A0A3Q9QSM9_9BACI|nr:helix-turn-helix domain-containing protein [Neobacillus mesonae]AZU62325.1 transcriptional regulator [Neobacillus mesonae]